jgi:tetratricopeptide (TPR) repeat protein
MVTAGMLASMVIGVMGITSLWIRASAEARSNLKLSEQKQVYLDSALDALDTLTKASENRSLHRDGFQQVRKEWLETIRNVYQKLALADGNSPDILLSRGQAYNKLAAISFDLDTFIDAFHNQAQAILELEKLNHTWPPDNRHKLELAKAYEGMAMLKIRVGEYSGAIEKSTDALTLMSTIPLEERDDDTRKEIARLENLLGVIYAEYNTLPQLAIAHYQHALTFVKAAEAPPLDEDWLELAAAAHNNLALCYRDLFDVDQALKNLQLSVQFNGRRTRSPDVVSHDCRMQIGVGSCLFLQNDYRAAEDKIRTALVTLRGLMSEYPSVHAYRGCWAYGALWLYRCLRVTGQLNEAEALLAEAAGVSREQVEARQSSTAIPAWVELAFQLELAQLRIDGEEFSDAQKILDIVIDNVGHDLSPLGPQNGQTSPGANITWGVHARFAHALDLASEVSAGQGKAGEAIERLSEAERHWRLAAALLDEFPMDVQLRFLRHRMRYAIFCGQDGKADQRTILDVIDACEAGLSAYGHYFECVESIAAIFELAAAFEIHNGRFENASEVLQREGELLHSLLKGVPENDRFRRELERCCEQIQECWIGTAERDTQHGFAR